MWLGDKLNQLKDHVKVANAFKHDKRSIEIRVIKGERKVQTAIFNDECCCFFLLKEKNVIYSSDLIVDDRNHLFKVVRVDDNSKIDIVVDDVEQSVDAIAVYCERYHIDNSLFEIVNSQKQTVNQVLNIHIDSIDGSQIGTIGSINSSNNMSQNIINKWESIRRELDWRFDYKEHQKYINSVDNAIAQNNADLVDTKAKEKTMKLLGGFLGELIGTFTTCLIEYFRNK